MSLERRGCALLASHPRMADKHLMVYCRISARLRCAKCYGVLLEPIKNGFDVRLPLSSLILRECVAIIEEFRGDFILPRGNSGSLQRLDF